MRIPLQRGVRLCQYTIQSEIERDASLLRYAAIEEFTHRAVVIAEYFPEHLVVRAGDGVSVTTTGEAARTFQAGLADFTTYAIARAAHDGPSVLGYFEANNTGYLVVSIAPPRRREPLGWYPAAKTKGICEEPTASTSADLSDRDESKVTLIPDLMAHKAAYSDPTVRLRDSKPRKWQRALAGTLAFAGLGYAFYFGLQQGWLTLTPDSERIAETSTQVQHEQEATTHESEARSPVPNYVAPAARPNTVRPDRSAAKPKRSPEALVRRKQPPQQRKPPSAQSDDMFWRTPQYRDR